MKFLVQIISESILELGQKNMTQLTHTGSLVQHLPVTPQRDSRECLIQKVAELHELSLNYTTHHEKEPLITAYYRYILFKIISASFLSHSV